MSEAPQTTAGQATGSQSPPSLRKVVIDPVTRVEGHGKVTIELNEAGEVEDARFHIVEFRGFERFIQGRMSNASAASARSATTWPPARPWTWWPASIA